MRIDNQNYDWKKKSKTKMMVILPLALILFGASAYFAFRIMGQTPEEPNKPISSQQQGNPVTEQTGQTESETPQGSESNSETQVVAHTETDGNSETETQQNSEPVSLPGTEAPGTEQPGNPPQQVVDIAALDNKSLSWGQGVHFDEKNRPAGSKSYQEKYGKYQAYFIGETEENIIYLTFDEGYENGFSPKILDTLKEKNVQVVFFCTLPFIKSNPELIKRMIDEGHTIGNHSAKHPEKGLPSLNLEQQTAEIMDVHNFMKENYNYDMNLFRYPAGIFSEQSLALVQNCSYKSVFWSFAYADWDPTKQPQLAEALEKLKARMHPGAIYLLHAVSETNTTILGDFIDQARAAGYTFARFE